MAELTEKTSGAGPGASAQSRPDAPLRIGPVTLGSRLIVGTGKYKDLDETAA